MTLAEKRKLVKKTTPTEKSKMLFQPIADQLKDYGFFIKGKNMYRIDMKAKVYFEFILQFNSNGTIAHLYIAFTPFYALRVQQLFDGSVCFVCDSGFIVNHLYNYKAMCVNKSFEENCDFKDYQAYNQMAIEFYKNYLLSEPYFSWITIDDSDKLTDQFLKLMNSPDAIMLPPRCSLVMAAYILKTKGKEAAKQFLLSDVHWKSSKRYYPPDFWTSLQALSEEQLLKTLEFQEANAPNQLIKKFGKKRIEELTKITQSR